MFKTLQNHSRNATRSCDFTLFLEILAEGFGKQINVRDNQRRLNSYQ